MRTIEWDNIHSIVRMIDQRKLPNRLEHVVCKQCQDVIEAIQTMAIRGAPAIGVAAAMGLGLTAITSTAESVEDLVSGLKADGQSLIQSRPTAISIQWAVKEYSAL